VSRAKPKSKARKPKQDGQKVPATDTPSRDALGYVELLGMTIEEIRELGQEKFEKLMEQAIEADRKRRYADIDAKLAAMQRMVEAGNTEQAFSLVRDEMRGMSDEVARQQAIAKKFARMVFGSRSEKLSREELKQLSLAFGVAEEAWNAAVNAGIVPNVPVEAAPKEDGDETAAGAANGTQKKRSGHKGRKPLALAAHVKVVENKILMQGAERACLECGDEMKTLRFLRHERMEVVPSSLVCHVELREVCTCGKCRKDAATAPNEDEDRTTRRVGTSVVADLVSEKCSEAQPLNRQHKRYERLGWTVPITTLESAYRWGTDLLGPIADIVRGEVLSADYMQADSTALMVLDPSHPSGRYRGQVWTFASQHGVAFDFCPTWEAQEVAPLFAVNWDAFKQVDDYKGYASLVTVEGVRRQLVPDHLRLGCMMHVRRKFHEALEAKDSRALAPIGIIRRIYEVEAAAKGRTPEERLALRCAGSLPLLAQLRDWVDKHSSTEPPKSLLGSAIRYTAAQWTYIERCFSRGDFEIDNGRPEREIRAIAIGRRNFLFTGSAPAASRLCDAYTLVVNAKRLGLDPFVYLRDVLDLLERGFAINRIAELTPRRYAAEKRQESADREPA
jgi:transposase